MVVFETAKTTKVSPIEAYPPIQYKLNRDISAGKISTDRSTMYNISCIAGVYIHQVGFY